MSHKLGTVLEVSSVNDIPEAADAMLRDNRVDAVAIRGCFLDVPDWTHPYGRTGSEATKWINNQVFAEPTTDIVRSWLKLHYSRRIPGVEDGWHHDAKVGVSKPPHIDTLYPNQATQVVGGLSLSLCTRGSGTFFAQRLNGIVAGARSRQPFTVKGNFSWGLHRIVASSVKPRSAIEHRAGDGILFASYPCRTVHAVVANVAVGEPTRRAELFDHLLDVRRFRNT